MTTRKIILYLALLAIILGAAPFVTGYLVEAKFNDVVKVISDIQSVPVSIKVTDYKRGWRKSSATTTITLKSNANQPSAYTITLVHHIHHGPLAQLKDGNYRDWHLALAEIHSHLLLSEEAKKILATEVGNTDLFHLNSQIAILGNVDMFIEGDPIKLKVHEGTERVAWKGVKGQWHLTRDLKHLKGEIVFPGFDIDWHELHAEGQNVSYKSELDRAPNGLWPGKFTLAAQEFKVSNSASHLMMTVQGVSTAGVLGMKDSIADFVGNLRIEKIEVDKQSYGLVNYTTSIKNIDASAIKRILELNQLMRTAIAPKQAEYIADYQKALIALLKMRPEFNIDKLQINTPQGDINGMLHFAVGGPQVTNAQISEIINSIAAKGVIVLPKGILRDLLMMQAIKNLHKLNQAQQNADLSQAQPNTALPKVLTEEEINQQATQQVSDILNKWLASGWWVEKDQNYSTDIEFQESKLKVNGKSMDGMPPAMAAPAAPVTPPPAVPTQPAAPAQPTAQ